MRAPDGSRRKRWNALAGGADSVDDAEHRAVVGILEQRRGSRQASRVNTSLAGLVLHGLPPLSRSFIQPNTVSSRCPRPSSRKSRLLSGNRPRRRRSAEDASARFSTPPRRGSPRAAASIRLQEIAADAASPTRHLHHFGGHRIMRAVVTALGSLRRTCWQR
jgi:hypothetical protein